MNMEEDVQPRRAYRLKARAEQARHTRARIVAAARDLFVERGFATTTIAAIAAAAEVAPETVYAIHKSKAGVLEAVVHAAFLRDDEPQDALERRWVKALLRLPDATKQIAAFARHTARTLELTSPIHAVIAEAGSGATELEALRRRLQDLRFSQQREVMLAITAGTSLRPGLSADVAAETFSALASPELRRVLTADRGWSRARYARWLEHTITLALAPARPDITR
jgi:AcrR family transcriptional regulator